MKLAIQKKKLILSLAMLLILSTLFLGTAKASPQFRVYVDPATTIANPGDTIMIYIKIAEAFIGVNYWEVKLGFDSAVLKFIDAFEGDFLSQDEANPTFFKSQEFPGYLLLGCMITEPTGVTGSGDLAYVTFEVIDTGWTLLDLFDTKLRDIGGVPIPHPAFDGEFYTLQPHATFTYSPDMPNKTQPVNFDASASYDPDGGTIVSYDWDFGDGTTDTGMTVTHAYSEGGVYVVILTVSDDDAPQLTDTDQKPINVLVWPPIASFTYSPTIPVVGGAVNFDASASSDPDGTIVSYDWDFGDGTTDTGMTVSHVYAEDVTYTVTLIVTDDDGLTGTAQVTLQPRLPAVADLKRKSAWPGKHHFVQSKHGQNNTLYGLVRNLGTEPYQDVLVQVVFTIWNNGGVKITDIVSSPYLLTVEERMITLSADFDTYLYGTGKFYVEASCLYDSDYDDTLDSVGTKIKTFSFAVVP